MLRTLLPLLVLGMWIYAFIDVLNTPEKEVRNLPKVAWVIIVLLFMPLGPIAWFIAGRPRRAVAGGGLAAAFGGGGSRGGRGGGWVAPDDNPDFLKSLGDEGKDRGREKKDEGEPDEAKGDEK
ncbi:PLD nuclease N-terminal domain-containing protein [Streptomyces sp. NPDC047315]|uniref:PLD nuclease N-terminal domain-containing protein n=1 Tax=Streptomyces sp. NPDC047315 TaxID=3155142 RepID=UPI0034078F49